MGVFYCCVKGCSSNSANPISLFKFPKEYKRRLTWVKNCRRDDLRNLSLDPLHARYKVCSLHFEGEMFTNPLQNHLMRNAVPTIFDFGTGFLPTPVLRTYGNKLLKVRKICEDRKDITEHPQASTYHLTSSPLPVASGRPPTILEFTAALIEEASTTCSIVVNNECVNETCEVGPMDQNENQEQETVSNTKTLRCRTCLKVTNAKQSIEVQRKCYLEKTIKETILMLVPEMALTLFDWDIICKTCCRRLTSSLKFIKTCLDVEVTIAEENRLLEGEHLKEHNYHRGCDLEAIPVTILPTTYEKGSANPPQHNGSDITDPLSAVEAIKDPFKDDITREHFDLLQKSNIPDSFDPALDRSEATDETVSCNICSKKLFSPADYQLHLKIRPSHICEKPGKRECVLCEICGKLLRPGTALELHKASHKKERPYMCHKCPKTYKTRHAYDKHEKQVHKRLSEQQCLECGKTFQTRGRCQMHYRLKHLKLTPFVCNVCGQKFGRKDYLQKHMNKHTSESEPKPRGRVSTLGFRFKHPGQPVACKICGKELASLDKLKLHLRTHTQMKRYKCRHCNLPFTTSSNRYRHERMNHRGNAEHVFRCNICFRNTNTEEELEAHMLVHKKRPPQHSCDTCGKKFYRSYLLSNHRMDEHVSPADMEKAEKDIVIKYLLEYAEPSS